MNGTQRALIIGVNGQDGCFLARHLHQRGWEVAGVARQPLPRADVAPFLATFHARDLCQPGLLRGTLEEVAPNLIVFAAAHHGPAGTDYESQWEAAHMVNTLAVHAVLEFIRTASRSTQFVYLSSSKIYGALTSRLITEETPPTPGCIYSITKSAAGDIVRYYRTQHRLRAATAVLFNHESERREPGFFVPKILAALNSSLGPNPTPIEVETLDFWCDWGSAEQYMERLAENIQTLGTRDCVLATGKTVWARDVVRELFARRARVAEDFVSVRHRFDQVPSERWTVTPSPFLTDGYRDPLLSGLDVFERVFRRSYAGERPSVAD